MKQEAPFALLVLVGCAAAPSAQQVVPAETHKAVVVTAGERHMTDDLYDDGGVEDQGTFGLSYEWEAGQFVWELGVLASEDDNHVNDPMFGSVKVDTKVQEAYLGPRYDFHVGVSPVRPYLGAGLSVVKVKADVSASGVSADDDDTSAGLYLHGGADWYISDSFFIGLDYRILTLTDIEVLDTDTDADYEMLALRVGYSF